MLAQSVPRCKDLATYTSRVFRESSHAVDLFLCKVSTKAFAPRQIFLMTHDARSSSRCIKIDKSRSWKDGFSQLCLITQVETDVSVTDLNCLPWQRTVFESSDTLSRCFLILKFHIAVHGFASWFLHYDMDRALRVSLHQTIDGFDERSHESSDLLARHSERNLPDWLGLVRLPLSLR